MTRILLVEDHDMVAEVVDADLRASVMTVVGTRTAPRRCRSARLVFEDRARFCGRGVGRAKAVVLLRLSEPVEQERRIQYLDDAPDVGCCCLLRALVVLGAASSICRRL
jgi:xanthine/CO dehydrogenase XdhC/CoxF family maturation factor